MNLNILYPEEINISGDNLNHIINKGFDHFDNKDFFYLNDDNSLIMKATLNKKYSKKAHRVNIYPWYPLPIGLSNYNSLFIRNNQLTDDRELIRQNIRRNLRIENLHRLHAIRQQQNSQSKSFDQLKKSEENTTEPLVKNAAIIVINSDNKIIVVKKTGGKWMLPGGNIDSGETSIDAAIREFNEETSFVLDKSKLSPIRVFNVTHHNTNPKSITRIYKVTTTQVFGTYDKTKVKNNETDDLILMTPSEIKAKLNTDYFVDYNINSFKGMISRGFF